MIAPLEDDLRALRHELSWPATPELAGPLPAQGAPRRAWRARRARLRVALAAALLLALAIASVPPARSAVLALVGLQGGAHARRVHTLPPAPPRGDRGRAPGTRTTLAAARARVAFPVRVPAVLGAPAAVHLWNGVPGGAVVLSYGDRGALWAFEGDAARWVRKLVTAQTAIRDTRVGASRASWVTGAPHEFLVEGRDGMVVQGSAAIVDANVLLWRSGRVSYRLETRRPLAWALAVAKSLRFS
jgi:hypothetical protein